MKESNFPIHDPLLSQDTNSLPVDILSKGERYQEDEEDERNIIEAKVERCPYCNSSQIQIITTKADHTVLHCSICRNYFCLYCRERLPERRRLDTRKDTIQCPKCQKTL